MKKNYFGKLTDGTDVYSYSFTNKNNMTMTFLDLGATLHSLLVPDKNGNLKDVVLGYETAQEYVDNGAFFGAVVGRSGNRIANGRFRIGDKSFQLAINDNDNNLHSGPDCYHSRKWAVTSVDEAACSITFELLSPDGDQGFPGNFRIQITYTLTDENEVRIHYQGMSDADTVANLTNHSYFNLGGHESGTILDHWMTLNADAYTAVKDSQAIPTGEFAAVEGTPMDFRQAKQIGQEIEADFQQLIFTKGYDHNFVLNGQGLRTAALTWCEDSGIAMETITDCCGVQFYAGNFITERSGKSGAVYQKRYGFCLETQYYPNSVNQPEFPSPILKAGEPYDTTTIYRFTIR